MTTKAEAIEALKIEYPTLRVGDDEQGYTDLNALEYEATIEAWADNLIAEQKVETEKQEARQAVETKLAALGLTADDLKALGL
jgi:hypothetical protein